MKHLYYIAALAATFLTAMPLHAQEEAENDATQQQQTRRRSPQASRGERNDKKDTGLPELTVRAQDMNERLTQEIGNARWMRIIYRQVDLMKEQNAPLYYPTRPMNGQMNLFSVIFQLLGENKIKAYEYLDGYEEFDEAHLINFKDLLDRFYILYEEIPGRAGEEPTFVINESDIPAADVRSYYVKEAWYFDQNNSAFDVKILAICPILTSTGDMGETTMPMFWLPYENIRPYISNSYIIKTQNLMNLPLQAYCPTPDSLKNEQARIEGQLTGFEKSLWYQPDTTQVAVDSKAAKKARKSAARGKGTTTKEPASEKKAPTVKAPKAEKSAPVRSVRRRR